VPSALPEQQARQEPPVTPALALALALPLGPDLTLALALARR
jgi:hypothetical protein